MEAAEKMRKKLSSNAESDMFIDQLMNGEDLDIKKLTRENFKEIIEKDFL